MSRAWTRTTGWVLIGLAILSAGRAGAQAGGGAEGIAPADAERARIERLEGLCRVWGTVKFFHPWLAYRDIDWDAALVRAIPLVDAATSAEEYRAAIGELLGALDDPITKPAGGEPATGEGDPAPAVAAPKPVLSWADLSDGKKAAVITMRDWNAIGGDPMAAYQGLLGPLFMQCGDAAAMVLDLRRQGPLPDAEGDIAAYVVAHALRSDLPLLLKEDVALPSARMRFHSGYSPQQGSTSGGYYSGFQVTDGEVLKAGGGVAAGKPLVVLTNEATRGVGDLLSAMQASGHGRVIFDGEDLSVFEGGATYAQRLPMDLSANIRTAEILNSDGSMGFQPDAIVRPAAHAGVGAKDGAGDAAMEEAIRLASGEWSARRPSGAAGPASARQRPEQEFAEPSLPDREHRLLALFRLWNVMHYFFPYMDHTDQKWDDVLIEFIPRFEAADTEAEYGLVIREMTARLQDSHVWVFGRGAAVEASSVALGTHSPPVFVGTVRGEAVVRVIGEGSAVNDEGLRVGDVILEVDGKSVAARRDEMAKYISASTPQAMLSRVHMELLRGPAESDCHVKVRRLDGTVADISVKRSGPQGLTWQLRQSAAWPHPAFTVLPEGYGYFDLVKLMPPQVDEAFEAVKDTPALIMDMRGYPNGTGWRICQRLTDRRIVMAKFHRPFWTSPDPDTHVDFSFDQPIGPIPLWTYPGRVVVLINEDAISQSEHSCLGFENAAAGRITFIGTPTTGANGDVTNTCLPGGVWVSFSGHDVRHADGRQLQRVGILPDIRVEPTIEGLVAGQDEVLAAAVKHLQGG